MGDGARLENERAARRLGVRLPPLPLKPGRVAQRRSTRLLSESMWVQVPPRPLGSECRWLTARHTSPLNWAPPGAVGSTPAHSAFLSASPPLRWRLALHGEAPMTTMTCIYEVR